MKIPVPDICSYKTVLYNAKRNYMRKKYFFLHGIGWRHSMIKLDSEKSLNPIEIRESLKIWVTQRFELGKGDILIDELGFYNKSPSSTVDKSFRADLALANGRLVGFEIKSEKDSLKRWEAQKVAYTNVFDEVWLCSHAKHLSKAIETTPDHIGVILVDNFHSLAVVRKATSSHGMNNIYDLAGLLWREEINELAEMHSVKIKSRATKREARETLAAQLALEEVRNFVLCKLKLRKS